MRKILFPLIFVLLLFVVGFIVLNGAHIIFTLIHIYYTILRFFALIGLLAVAFAGYKLFFAKKN